MTPIEAKLVIEAEMIAKNRSEGIWSEGHVLGENQQFSKIRRPMIFSKSLGKVLVWAGNKLLQNSQRDEILMTS